MSIVRGGVRGECFGPVPPRAFVVSGVGQDLGQLLQYGGPQRGGLVRGERLLAGLARVAKALGEHEAAEQGFRDALAIYERLGAAEAAELARKLAPEGGPGV